MLFDLPEALVTSILHQWVDIRALQHLDSACCRTLLREQLLQMFSGETFILGVDAVSSTNHGECLGWLTKRKLRFSSVALYTYVDTG
jgi:hypothetical protein